MKYILYLYKASAFSLVSLRKNLLLLRRYPLNTFSRLVTIYGFFLVIFIGGRAVAPSAINDTLEGIIVGFFLFTIAQTAMFRTAANMMSEARWGTLEQLYMSPLRFSPLILIKSFVNVMFGFLIASVVLILIILTTGKSLHLDIVSIVPIAVLTLSSAVGIGLILAGLAVLFKNIKAMFGPLEFTMAFLLAAPVSSNPWMKLLPLSLGSHLLRKVMVENVSIVELPVDDLLLLVGVAFLYIGLGIIVFQAFLHITRRRNKLGEY